MKILEDEYLLNGKVRPVNNVRRDFRSKCRKAMKEIQEQGGIREWSVVHDRKKGRKTNTYHYTHAKTRQLELQMFDS